MSTDDLGAGIPGAEASGAAGLTDDERAELAQLRSTLRHLEPYADDITRFVNDESYRNYVREGAKIFDTVETQRKPQLSPEIAAVRDEIMEAIKPQREMVEKYNRTQEDELSQRKAKVFNEGRLIVEPFLQQHPELKTRAFGATLDALQQDALERNVPFKEVWDNYVTGFAPARQERKAPPPSLRANDGEAGIPAAQQRQVQREDGRPLSIKDAYLSIARRGKAS